MCGFAGIFSTRGYDAEALAHHVRGMADRIIHRGPDDGGVWCEAGAGLAFGFRRLAIIDLSAHGHQPMRSRSGRFTIVFNGEVFNHGELRRELEGLGHTFRGHSDTETILAAFEQWGIAASVRRFVGMFAIAVWDAHSRTLSLIRDRLGIKPLFVYWRPGHLMFGSELKALVAGPDFDGTLNHTDLPAYLRYLYFPAPASVFEYVQKLRPGHIITIRSADVPLPDSEAYWSVLDVAGRGAADPFPGSESEAIDELERILTDAVRLRLQADVPIGALLSGGIDSSAVVALAQRESDRPLRTYSIGFDVGEYNEAPAAARVAKHLGTEHTEMMVSGAEALDVIPRLPELFDEPLANPSQVPTYLVCHLARREVVVALSGDGGDEVLGGYHRYIQGEQLIGQLLRVPRPLRQPVGAGMGRISSGAWDRAYQSVSTVLPSALKHRLPGEKLVKLGHLMERRSDLDMYRSLLSAWQRPERLVRRGIEAPSAVDHAFAESSSLPLLGRMMATDQATYLADDLLAKVDRASMATSLEVRVPLLDHRVVEFAWRLPRSLKIRDGQGKWALRQVLNRHVPNALVDRPKMGFTVPTAAWLRGPLRAWAEDLIQSVDSTGPLDAPALGREWRAFLSGRRSTATGLWAVLMYQAWRARWSA